MLSITLNNVDSELKDNSEKIKLLTEDNAALNIKISSLQKNIKDDYIFAKDTSNKKQRDDLER